MFQAIIPAVRAVVPVAINVAKTTVEAGALIHCGILAGAAAGGLAYRGSKGAYRLGQRGISKLRQRAAIRQMERDIENELDACAIIADHF